MVRLRGIGLLGPGLADWATGQSLLLAPSGWVPAATVLAPPSRLPPAERRRAGAIVKLSINVADQACAGAGIDTGTLATVFTASSGDANNCHALCESLASADPIVSPTRFTNSVHNAAAGYWHIATGSRAPSTSLCGFDASFGAGLLEAASQCVAGQRPVLLVAGDVPYPEPIHSLRPMTDAFGVALLLCPDSDAADGPAPGTNPGPDPGHGLRLSLRLRSDAVEPSRCGHAALDVLRLGAPAARALPLLQAVALGGPTTVILPYLDRLMIEISITPGQARWARP